VNDALTIGRRKSILIASFVAVFRLGVKVSMTMLWPMVPILMYSLRVSFEGSPSTWR
jgi:hypothetical protein